MYDGLNAFDKNVDSVEGETWQRHRKITAPSFNERVNSGVWTESLSQAGQMLREWSSQPEGTRDLVDDTATLTLHIFTYAGFGLKYPFKAVDTQIEYPHTMSYRETLHVVVRNYTLLIMLPMAVLKLPVASRHMQKVGRACDDFKLYMKEMVQHEKMSVSEGKSHEANNLLGALVQASQGEKQGLDDDELYGNLFIYNMAGHETTANAVAAAIAYLAATPKWQDWLREEISAVSKGMYDVDSWRYENMFPKLIRCRAVMLETLRLNNSAPFIPKAAANGPQAIAINGATHVIPVGTFVVTNLQALHCDPNTWGEDALTWRPDRWIASSPGQEWLIETTPGSFVAWSEGPRVCPGKNFSQVEFAAVMAVLFRDHSVKPKMEMGESVESASRRVLNMIEDSGIMAITLQTRRPRDVALIRKACC